MEILHHVVGPGTAWMADRKPGDRVNILGPVGTPFRVDAHLDRAVLVGGGIGIPPLIWLARTLTERHVNTLVLYGVRSADAMPLRLDPGAAEASRHDEAALCIDEFSRHGVPAVVCTDDGSIGRRGFVTDALAAHFNAHPPEARTGVFTCGPDVMVRTVAEICKRANAACQVCLERVMGCSLGTCQSCVVPVTDAHAKVGWRYRLCCTDGPVFDGSAVLWSTPRS
jgi:dihydroorotate dehydrogenase electron transfer subunit